MSLITQAFIVEKYGIRLDTDQLADLLGITTGALLTKIVEGTCPIKTYKDGKRRFADYRDVAEHLDKLREIAA